MRNQRHLFKIAFSGIMTAISLVLMLVNFHFPFATFLEYNPSDIPILMASLFLGPVYGTVIALLVSIIQAATISASSGMYGFLMHFIASGVLALVAGTVFKCMKKASSPVRLVSALAVGGVVSALLMIPANLIVTPLFLGSPVQAVFELLIPAIIPFNFLKMAINCTLSGIMFAAMKKTLANFYG